jgi:NADPH:quinone reductase-like Zn-dependent oxidoreductase
LFIYFALLPFISAGAGGVGSWAIQLASWAGAYVSCTCSKNNFDFVKSLGCHRPIDYNTEPFEKIHWGDVPPPDIVMDLIGGDYELRSLQLLPKKYFGEDGATSDIKSTKQPTTANSKKCGHLRGHYLHVLNSGWETYFRSSSLKFLMPFMWVGFTAAMLSLSTVGLLGLHYSFTIVLPSSKDLLFISQLLQNKDCRAIIDTILPFNAQNMRIAHDRSEEGHCRGKIVLQVGCSGGGSSCRSSSDEGKRCTIRKIRSNL